MTDINKETHTKKENLGEMLNYYQKIISEKLNKIRVMSQQTQEIQRRVSLDSFYKQLQNRVQKKSKQQKNKAELQNNE